LGQEGHAALWKLQVLVLEDGLTGRTPLLKTPPRRGAEGEYV